MKNIDFFLQLNHGSIYSSPHLDLGIKAEDIGYVLGSLGLELLLYLAVSAFVCWLCASMKNVGLVIVLYVAVLMALTMIGSILSVIIAVLEHEQTAETAVSIMKFFQNINIFNYGLLIGKGDSYETKQLLYYSLTPVIAGVSLLGLGIIKFNKKDLK